MKVTVEMSKVLVSVRTGLAEMTEVELPEDATVGDALAAVGLPQGLWGIVVIGDRVGSASTRLFPGDRVTVFPPVSGG